MNYTIMMNEILIFLYRDSCTFLLEGVWTEIDLISIKLPIAEQFIAIELKEGIKETRRFHALLM